MSEAPLKWDAQLWERGLVRLDIRGDFNAESGEPLEKEFHHWFAKSAYSFVIGLAGVQRMTSGGGALLVTFIRIAQEHGGQATLVDPSDPVRRTLERLGVFSLCHTVGSLEEVFG